MKRTLPLLSLLLALALAGCGAQGAASAAPSAAEPSEAAAEPLSVCASFYTMYDFASKIGGDRVAVTNLVPSGMEPHDWEPSAGDLAALEEADVFIYSGAGMEHWVDTVLASLSNESLVTAETSAGIPLLAGGHSHDDEEEAEADHDEEEAESYDPHVWLNPQYAKLQMAAIRDAFTQADPEGADYYAANYDTYAARLDDLDADFRETLSPLPNHDIVVAHQAFGYLCQAYGLNQIAIEGLSADSEPDPARVAEIITLAQERQVKVIFFEELISPKVAETIADAAGAETMVLSPIEGLSDDRQAAGDDYFSVMEQNLEALSYALS